MEETIRNELIVFICENFMVDEDDIEYDKSMIDEGIIDSFGLVEIAAFMNRKYNIKVKEDQMIPDNFGSLNKIVAFILHEMKHDYKN